jgi:hypothetical protein
MTARTRKRSGGLLLVMAVLLLAGCSALPKLGGGGDDAAGGSGGLNLGLGSLTPSHVIVAEKPSDVYTRLARQIYACWLSSDPPLLPGQMFYAETEPGDTGEARISLHTPGEDNHKGLRTYAISMRRVPEGTQIETEPLRIEDAAQRDLMHRSVMAWAQGETACDAGKVPGAAVAAPAVPVPPADVKAAAAPAKAAKPSAAKAAAAASPKAGPQPKGPRTQAAPAQTTTVASTPAAASKPQPAEATPQPQPDQAPRPSRSIALRGAIGAEPPAAPAAPPLAPPALAPQPLAAPPPAPAAGPPAVKLPTDNKFLQTEPTFAGH